MERIHIDILRPFIESAGRNRYILLMIDQFTKLLNFYAIPNEGTEQHFKSIQAREEMSWVIYSLDNANSWKSQKHVHHRTDHVQSDKLNGIIEQYCSLSFGT